MADSEVDSETHDRLCDRVSNAADSVLWTYKAHFEAADHYNKRSRWLDWGTTIGAGILTIALIWESVPTVFPIGLAILTAVFSGYKTASEPQKEAESHYRAGKAYHKLFEDFRDFIKLDLADTSRPVDELEDHYRNLSERRKELNDDMPDLEDRWYNRLDDSIYEEIETTEKAEEQILGSVRVQDRE